MEHLEFSLSLHRQLGAAPNFCWSPYSVASALGLAATPAQTALLASPAPVLYFPQIKRHMWDKPVIQRHVAELRAEGNTVIDPVETTTYQMWKREEDIGFAMPGAEEAAKIVRDWLADRPATP